MSKYIHFAGLFVLKESIVTVRAYTGLKLVTSPTESIQSQHPLLPDYNSESLNTFIHLAPRGHLALKLTDRHKLNF